LTLTAVRRTICLDFAISKAGEGYGVSTELSLRDFAPEPMLVTDSHLVHSAKFRAIDAHNHLGRWLSTDHSWTVPDVSALLAVMDSCNLQAIINLDGMWGDELECNLDRYDRAHPGRFHTFAQCDWSLVRRPDFGARLARQLEQSAAQGAKGLKVWKHLGLRYRDADDVLIPIDDQRLDDLWHTAGQLRLPVMIHVADPVAFFRPLDPTNERWEQLHVHPEWHFPSPPYPSFSLLLEQFERLIARHPATTFIGAHVGCYAENLRWVARMCDTYANFAVDIAARVAELGRQPYTAKWFFERYADRILFGLDLFPPRAADYAPYFRFLETADEYFSYSAKPIGGDGRWQIYGIHLGETELRKVYAANATRLILDRLAPAPPRHHETEG
jgi:predicted TIM-barrel fold metal-dependent hydrolase